MLLGLGVLGGCGPEARVVDDDTASVSSELGVSFAAREYGIERIWDQNGRQLLVPTGMYVIGSRSGTDNPDTNYWTKGGSSTVLKNSHGEVGPAYSMRTSQVNATTISFQVSVGPLPFQMNALSLSFDWEQARIQRFKYSGSGFRDDCRAGLFRQTDVGYDELPQCHVITNDQGEVVARAGAAKVYPASSWVEFTGDFEGKVRVTFTSLSGARSSQFFNHSGSHAFGLEFAEGATSTQGATYAASGTIELLPATAVTTPPPSSPPSTPTGSQLTAGQSLSGGQLITSANGSFTAVMQADGNFVVYQGANATWSTQTAGKTGVRAVMQSDGNFVLYQGTSPLWHTHTNGQANAVLKLQDSGVLAVLLNGAVLWSSQSSTSTPTPTPTPTPTSTATQVRGGTTLTANTTVTSPNGLHRLVMQADGNLVLYSSGAAAWATGTNGRANVKAVMQTDGNFVLYQGTTAVWNTQTNGQTGAVLELRDDGALAVMRAGAEVWHR